MSSGTAASTRWASCLLTEVDVGLLGLLTMIRRVRSLTAAIMASMLCRPSLVRGIWTLSAPADETMMG